MAARRPESKYVGRKGNARGHEPASGGRSPREAPPRALRVRHSPLALRCRASLTLPRRHQAPTSCYELASRGNAGHPASQHTQPPRVRGRQRPSRRRVSKPQRSPCPPGGPRNTTAAGVTPALSWPLPRGGRRTAAMPQRRCFAVVRRQTPCRAGSLVSPSSDSQLPAFAYAIASAAKEAPCSRGNSLRHRAAHFTPTTDVREECAPRRLFPFPFNVAGRRTKP